MFLLIVDCWVVLFDFDLDIVGFAWCVLVGITQGEVWSLHERMNVCCLCWFCIMVVGSGVESNFFALISMVCCQCLCGWHWMASWLHICWL